MDRHTLHVLFKSPKYFKQLSQDAGFKAPFTHVTWAMSGKLFLFRGYTALPEDVNICSFKTHSKIPQTDLLEVWVVLDSKLALAAHQTYIH